MCVVSVCVLCSVLQYGPMCYNCDVMCCNVRRMLQRVAVCCSVLQRALRTCPCIWPLQEARWMYVMHACLYYSALQRDSARIATFGLYWGHGRCVGVCVFVLQCVVIYCIVLHCAAIFCSVHPALTTSIDICLHIFMYVCMYVIYVHKSHVRPKNGLNTRIQVCVHIYVCVAYIYVCSICLCMYV